MDTALLQLGMNRFTAHLLLGKQQISTPYDALCMVDGL
jgi:hypothetical protein